MKLTRAAAMTLQGLEILAALDTRARRADQYPRCDPGYFTAPQVLCGFDPLPVRTG